MATREIVRTYAELADLEHQRGAEQERDRFLILAADAALLAGMSDEAEEYRGRLLEHNPHHLLKPYPSMAEALKSSEVLNYVADLRKSYPPAEAMNLLATLKETDKAKDGIGQSELATEASTAAAEAKRGAGGLDFGSLRGAAGQSAPEKPQAEPTEPAPRRIEPVAPAVLHREPDLEREEQPAAVGSWVADSLFVLVLVAGVLLAGYTLLRPFLPLAEAPFK